MAWFIPIAHLILYYENHQRVMLGSACRSAGLLLAPPCWDGSSLPSVKLPAAGWPLRLLVTEEKREFGFLDCDLWWLSD